MTPEIDQLECPVNPFMNIINGKWTIHILWELYQENNHYGSLLKSLPGISTRTLSTRLKMLENNNIITRKVITETNPPMVSYPFTEKGLSLVPILMSMKNWSEEYSKH
ncbi:winged helix-turn-helix transcriptional regulator [Eupransor demetentiae]|uniref:HxlR family (HxlR) n=1 Tax=Eupransor demetentiae TaxID=3109584 RepID=A0ABM9N476_9LACO|nr:DNA-binding transcriptional regulator [Lactobacillaceae bacterium LMG 33000]